MMLIKLQDKPPVFIVMIIVMSAMELQLIVLFVRESIMISIITMLHFCIETQHTIHLALGHALLRQMSSLILDTMGQ